MVRSGKEVGLCRLCTTGARTEASEAALDVMGGGHVWSYVVLLVWNVRLAVWQLDGIVWGTNRIQAMDIVHGGLCVWYVIWDGKACSIDWRRKVERRGGCLCQCWRRY
jgi:hypothetical protein